MATTVKSLVKHVVMAINQGRFNVRQLELVATAANKALHKARKEMVTEMYKVGDKVEFRTGRKTDRAIPRVIGGVVAEVKRTRLVVDSEFGEMTIPVRNVTSTNV